MCCAITRQYTPSLSSAQLIMYNKVAHFQLNIVTFNQWFGNFHQYAPLIQWNAFCTLPLAPFSHCTGCAVLGAPQRLTFLVARCCDCKYLRPTPAVRSGAIDPPGSAPSHSELFKQRSLQLTWRNPQKPMSSWCVINFMLSVCLPAHLTAYIIYSLGCSACVYV